MDATYIFYKISINIWLHHVPRNVEVIDKIEVLCTPHMNMHYTLKGRDYCRYVSVTWYLNQVYLYWNI